ncbi:hypothetical protein SAMN02787076_06242 [Rhizobacter sp. OV335]|nr:hypothetical protein SAMN02787076_06242 [Rhizobacter sp. OV335]
MRNMSFALTKAQIKARTKDVTRRMGWLHLNPGEQFRPVEKCMGLRPGEKVQPLEEPVTALGIRREQLRAMTDDECYGREECRREGFPDMTPAEFVAMFCKTHKGCTPETVISRIVFGYAAPNT